MAVNFAFIHLLGESQLKHSVFAESGAPGLGLTMSDCLSLFSFKHPFAPFRRKEEILF